MTRPMTSHNDKYRRKENKRRRIKDRLRRGQLTRGLGKSQVRRHKYLGNECAKCHHLGSIDNPLTIDHIDNDRQNNGPTNFQTLCFNCNQTKETLSGT